jgi:hypothetical protein
VKTTSEAKRLVEQWPYSRSDSLPTNATGNGRGSQSVADLAGLTPRRS